MARLFLMGLIDNIREDINDITSDLDGWGVPIEVITPAGASFNIVGTHKKINLGLNMQTGETVNSKTATASFSEAVLLAAGCSIRDANNEVELEKYKFNIKDNTGVLCHYVSKEWFPDETVGLIVVILDDYNG